jgi:hypothetical protein
LTPFAPSKTDTFVANKLLFCYIESDELPPRGGGVGVEICQDPQNEAVSFCELLVNDPAAYLAIAPRYGIIARHNSAFSQGQGHSAF